MIDLFISSIVKDNVVLTKYFGLSFNKINYIYITLITLISGIIVYLLNSIINLPFLIPFIATIVIILISLLLKKFNIKIDNLMNTAILGIILLGLDYSFVKFIVYIVGSILGLLLIYYVLSLFDKKLKNESIIFIAIGIMSMIFLRIG